MVFKGIIAYIQVVVAPKRVWGPSNFISNFKFTKFHKIPTAVSISEEWPGDPGGTHLRRKFIRRWWIDLRKSKLVEQRLR